jgi:Tfp pilus assembly protein PilF
MTFSPRRWLHRQSRTAVFMAAALLIAGASATDALAQMGGVDSDPGDPGTGGRNTISGSIFLPGGRRLDRRAKVQLTGLAGGALFRLSDDSGAFSFTRLQGGRYTVVVDAGPEFELESESVDIIEPARRRGDPGLIQTVYFTLKPRKTPTGTVGTVDASSVIPEPARELYADALESAKNGDRKKAIDQLNQALKIHQNFPLALNELGVQYIGIKQYDKAIESLKAALKLAPEFFHARLNYGIALILTKDFKGAVLELQQAAAKDPASAAAQVHLGRAYVTLGNYKAAETALKRCIEIGGEASTEAHRYLAAVYIETQQSGKAADELEAYLQLAPKTRDADQIRAIIRDLRAQAAKR